MTISKKDKLRKQAEEPIHSNYLKIKFSYNCTMIFPYEDGIKLIEACKYAENLNTDDYQNNYIDNKSINLDTTVLSREEYLDLKMKYLLGLTTSEENTK